MLFVLRLQSIAGGTRLNDEQRWWVIISWKDGQPKKTIARNLNLSINTVRNTIKRYQESGGIKDRKRIGRKAKTTQREDRWIIRQAKLNRRATSTEIQKGFKALSGKVVSSSLVRKRLIRSKMICRRAVKKPLLSSFQRLRRLRWAKAYKNWSLRDWRRVVFSDESKFLLFSDRSSYVRRMPGEAMLPQCLQPTVKHGGGGVMVWGCISYSGVGRLHRVDGNVTGAYYQKILKFCALPSQNHLYPNGEGIFMQDNAPVHTSKANLKFLRDSGVNVLPWPGQSPDLNPIENLWQFLKHKVQGRRFHNCDELFETLQRLWNSIPQTYIRKLIDSMPGRCRMVISRHGWPTK